MQLLQHVSPAPKDPLHRSETKQRLEAVSFCTLQETFILEENVLCNMIEAAKLK